MENEQDTAQQQDVPQQPAPQEPQARPGHVRENGEHGFPPATPLTEMTVDQREAYWRHQAKKHEQTWKSVIDRNLTPDQVLEMQQKLEDVRREQMDDHEKALADARKEAAQETRKTLVPDLVRAKLEAAVARRDPSLTDDDVAAKVEFLDLTRFLTKNGEVDADKVSAWATANVAVRDEHHDDSGGRKKFPDMGGGKRGPAPESAKARADRIARARGYVRD